MPDTVLLALDGSEKDDRGLAAAEAIAELTGAVLQLVHVTDERGDIDDVRVGLEVAAGRLRKVLGHDVPFEVLRGSDAATELVRFAARHRPLLVAMATRAAGPVGRALRGSVADRVMHESPVPVLLVPPGADDMGGRHPSFTRVLVPLDGSASSTRALDYLLRLPRATALEYVLLEVVAHDRDRATATMHLETAVQQVRAAGATTVEIDVGFAHAPAPVIVAAVREALVDLIAMSSRGRGGAKRLVLGSVAEGVVRHAEVPVLLLTPATLDAH